MWQDYKLLLLFQMTFKNNKCVYFGLTMAGLYTVGGTSVVCGNVH